MSDGEGDQPDGADLDAQKDHSEKQAKEGRTSSSRDAQPGPRRSSFCVHGLVVFIVTVCRQSGAS